MTSIYGRLTQIAFRTEHHIPQDPRPDDTRTIPRLPACPAVVRTPSSPFSGHIHSPNQDDHSEVDSSEPAPRCAGLEAADDVVVIFKTGATESERVPAHIHTDLACLPHLLLGSDAEEDIDGLHLEDILKGVTDEVKSSEPDFSFYRTLHGLLETGHSVTEALEHSTTTSKEDSPAWKLDKWKFEPLLHTAVERHPFAKWYIFMEADTYIIWPVMLSYLERYDHTERRYMGAQNLIGDKEFAHGGSGYVLSREAAHAASAFLLSEPDTALGFVRGTCCGDMAMGDILRSVGTGLTNAWPTIQGETPSTQDYTATHWCSPVATFHHMSPDDIAELWRYEQTRPEKPTNPILHRDIYTYFVQPRLQARLEDWDNLSSYERSLAASGDPSNESFETCQALCESSDKCLQFSWRVGECHTSHILRLGGSSFVGGIISGFMLNRVGIFTADLGLAMSPIGQDRRLKYEGIDHIMI